MSPATSSALTAEPGASGRVEGAAVSLPPTPPSPACGSKPAPNAGACCFHKARAAPPKPENTRGVSMGWMDGRAASAGSPGAVGCSLRAPRSRTCSIWAMGVMPAIGSVENAPMRNAMAPTSLPSMYTGLPLMPATTPVYSALAPVSRPRIRSSPGPCALWRMPRMSTPNGSGTLPSKTV